MNLSTNFTSNSLLIDILIQTGAFHVTNLLQLLIKLLL